MAFDFEKELKVTETNIPGLLVFDLPVHGDNRGWFKENWQRAKMMGLGLPDFGPVQNNISFNATKGVTRGIHAEPWDKYISIAAGEIFGAWVDLRPGESFGQVFTTRLDPSKAIYVPRGVGNSFQALQDGTVYTYLVNAHWSLEQKKTYTFVNLADPELGIEWPIPLEESERSEADLHHPMLKDAKPMEPKRTLVTGCNGQLGRAVRAYAEAHGLRGFEYTDINEFDFSDPAAYDEYDWSLYGTIINAEELSADKCEIGENMLGHGPSTPKGPRCCLVRRRIIMSHWCMRAPIRFTEPIRKPKRSPRRASTGRRRLRATSRWRMRRNTTSCDARNPPIPGTSWTRCSSCSILTPNTASMPSVTDWTARKHQDQGRTSV